MNEKNEITTEEPPCCGETAAPDSSKKDRTAPAAKAGSGAPKRKRKSSKTVQKERFVSLAWENINAANELIGRQLRRAAEQEEQIDGLILYFESLKGGEIGEKQRQTLIEKIEKLKMEDLKKLTSTLGTLCDKQAQALPDGEDGAQGILVTFEGELDDYAR